MGNRNILIVKYACLLVAVLLLVEPCKRVWWLLLEQQHIESHGIPSGFTAVDYLNAALGDDWS